MSFGLGVFGETDFDAFFLEEMLNAPQCLSSTSDGCVVVDCRPVGTNVPLRFLSAGQLSVRIGDGGLEVSPHPTTNFYQATIPGPFVSGAAAQVTASGRTIPPFTFTETIPRFADVMVDGCGRFFCDQPFSRDAGLTLRWDGGSDEVFVSVVEQVLSGRYVTCRFPASAGTGWVSPAALASLPNDSVIIAFGTQKVREVDVGPFRTTVFLEARTQLTRTLRP